eukprot:6591484-Prymnesium_polylepis.1
MTSCAGLKSPPRPRYPKVLKATSTIESGSSGAGRSPPARTVHPRAGGADLGRPTQTAPHRALAPGAAPDLPRRLKAPAWQRPQDRQTPASGNRRPCGTLRPPSDQ